MYHIKDHLSLSLSKKAVVRVPVLLLDLLAISYIVKTGQGQRHILPGKIVVQVPGRN